MQIHWHFTSDNMSYPYNLVETYYGIYEVNMDSGVKYVYFNRVKCYRQETFWGDENKFVEDEI